MAPAVRTQCDACVKVLCDACSVCDACCVSDACSVCDTCSVCDACSVDVVLSSLRSAMFCAIMETAEPWYVSNERSPTVKVSSAHHVIPCPAPRRPPAQRSR